MSTAEVWDDLPEVRVRVPAKINLALRVGRTRSDGYHELATIFQAVSLYDEVAASRSETITCEVSGIDSHIIGPGKENLAFRAARLLQQEYGVREGVDLHIDKRIPVAGGMAGGSADAAGALLACTTLWGLPTSSEDLMVLAGRLGADVPFPLMGGCALGRGRGEILTPTLSRGLYHWVLALSPGHLATPEVFRRFDTMAPADLPRTPDIPPETMMALTSGNVHRVAACLVNDLAPAACSLMPELYATINAGRDAGCLAWLVSGSGPTVAFLAENESTAMDLAVALSSAGVARDVRLVTGPVPGATVLP